MMTLEVSEEKKKALNVAVSQIEKAHGKGSIMRLGVDGPKVQVAAIPTGAIRMRPGRRAAARRVRGRVDR